MPLTLGDTFPHNSPSVFAHTVVALVVEAVNELGGPRDDVEVVSVFNASCRGQDIGGVHNNSATQPAAVLMGFR